MNIEYISDDDERGGYHCDSVNSTDNHIKVADDDLHQILNYPPLEKHSSNKIVSICNEIDLIDMAIDGVSEAQEIYDPPIVKSKKHIFFKLKTKPIKRLKRYRR